MWCALRRRARLLATAAALACLAAAAQASPTGLPTEWRAGKATYYGGMPDGCACALHGSMSGTDVHALNQAETGVRTRAPVRYVAVHVSVGR